MNPVQRFFAPQSILRLEFLRILLPLAILGFLSSRIMNPVDWLTGGGFHIPDLGHKDWRQPFYIPPLPIWAAVGICVSTAMSGLALSAGFKTRIAACVFALCLIFTALADRLESFTVSKLGAVLALALFLTPGGKAIGVDAWLASKSKGTGKPLPSVTWGNIRFFQILTVTLYAASGLSKMRGDWLTHDHVLWTHLHDSYQTPVAYWVARLLPFKAWTFFQYLVLAFETGAPIWFLLPFTRKPALWVALGMHVFIGLCFGPVIWFALLMIILVFACFAPLPWLSRLLRRPYFDG
jgi:uncharacterized membrane protein YphA (DoxX/SURF4 family)